MATTITAGNATNGLAFSADNTGILELKTGTGSGTTAVTLDASQNATFAGTVTSPTGALYPLISGTAVASTSGTSVTFTGIPSTAKRVTVMFQGVSLSGTSAPLIQIGAGSVVTSGYLNGYIWTGASGNSTTGFQITTTGSAATAIYHGSANIILLSTNNYIANGSFGRSDAAQAGAFGGSLALGGVLDRVRVTTVNGTDTFDAGTINILWE